VARALQRTVEPLMNDCTITTVRGASEVGTTRPPTCIENEATSAFILWRMPSGTVFDYPGVWCPILKPRKGVLWMVGICEEAFSSHHMLYSPLDYVIQLKTLVASESYRMDVTCSIPVNRTCRRLEREIQRCPLEWGITSRRSGRSTGVLSVASVQ
jgi:hypothetical protein